MCVLLVSGPCYKGTEEGKGEVIRFFGLLFVFLILFSAFSLEVDRYFSGEIYGKVYGFPVFWHGDGSSSLARAVYIPGMFVCMLFYIILSFSVLSVLEVLVRVFKVGRRVGMIFLLQEVFLL